MGRYDRNISTLSPEENEGLREFRVCVVGCGGLGGYVIEMLGRLGVGCITAVDGDVFEESNLNRQLLSEEGLLGTLKAEAAQERMKKVNSLVKVQAVRKRLTRENAEEILSGHNAAVDALDNIESRFVLQDACEKLGIPLIHGAIGGWYGQVTSILPGDRTLNRLYRREDSGGIEGELGNPSFTPALVAALEVSEVIKLFTGRGEPLRKKLLYINLLENEYEVIEL